MALRMYDALTAGVERVSAWADVLDSINVFPVPDGDTGRNLVLTLSPLRGAAGQHDLSSKRLLLSARGNSGNIAAQFLSGFLDADTPDGYTQAVKTGCEKAWRAVHRPLPGTMLTVFDALFDHLNEGGIQESDTYLNGLIDRLSQATRATTSLLDDLKPYDVVDAGALGMFLFFEGYFNRLLSPHTALRSIADEFKGALRLNTRSSKTGGDGFCIDSVIRVDRPSNRIGDKFAHLGKSAVVLAHDDIYKVHLHTDDIEAVQKKLASIGTIVQWRSDDIGRQIDDFKSSPTAKAVHIMTDAAGSLTRQDARRLGITLLDSYINAGGVSLPETLLEPADLYALMKSDTAVSTSQASIFERHQTYERVMALYDQVLYLCVGSAFTGNFRTAEEWKRGFGQAERFTVIDTGAASGRLALIVMAAARYARQAASIEAVADFARQTIPRCTELIFLDRLKFLARGGRLSKKNAWLGDMLHVKPIVSPTAEGAVRVGRARSRQDQVQFALGVLEKQVPHEGRPVVMLEYSDNKAWLQEIVLKEIERRYPAGRVFLQPFSVTSGAHMGPGTWAMAFLADDFEDSADV